jgi:predicted RNA-binding protein with PIN domain
MAPKRQEVILLVDGYNVIGAWKDLYPNEETPLQQTHGEELEVARNKLIEQKATLPPWYLMPITGTPHLSPKY